VDISLNDLGPLVIGIDNNGAGDWVRIERAEGRWCTAGLMFLEPPHARQLRDWLNANVKD
jgi:hypothetical protein